jgi:hypothetical protein
MRKQQSKDKVEPKLIKGIPIKYFNDAIKGKAIQSANSDRFPTNYIKKTLLKK